jgi:integrase
VSVVRVQWREPKRKTRTFDDSRNGIASAKAYARGVHDRLGAPADSGRVYPQVTLRELFDRYIDANEIDWRDATAEGKRNHWQLLELHVGKEKIASTLTKEHLDSLKKALINSYPKGGDRKKSINQVRATLNMVVGVYKWAIDHEVIPPTKLITYRAKFAKNLAGQVVKTAEYSQEEREKVTAAMDMNDSRNWRAAVLTTLFRYCGPRKNAALQLQWPDVDFVNERIRWRPETDKRGRERFQPMPAPVRDALKVAYLWSLKFGYSGQWVFFRPGAGTESYRSGLSGTRPGRRQGPRGPGEGPAVHLFRVRRRPAPPRGGRRRRGRAVQGQPCLPPRCRRRRRARQGIEGRRRVDR